MAGVNHTGEEMRIQSVLKNILFYLVLPYFVAISLTACAQGRMLAASFRSTDHFIPLSSDKRVFYEPGSEQYAHEIAKLLPEAIHSVETAHYLPFKDDVAVYICSSNENCYRQTGHKAPAIVTHKLFISPALFQEKKPVDHYLTHELSHLQLLQRLGMLKLLKLPTWFKEGLAEFVSGGATGAQITDEEAIRAVSEGRHFIPDAERGVVSSFLSPRFGSYWHLSEPMFYHQSMLFVKFLHDSDEKAFHDFLTEIQSGKDFDETLSNAYGNNLGTLWGNYLRYTKTNTNHSARAGR